MKQYVIIGNSAAGISAIEAIRKIDRQSKIIVVSVEDYAGYCRCLISYYLAGDIKEDKILYRESSFYKENNVELLVNKKVVRVDSKKNRIICEDKTQISYDYLLIATGASSKMPDIKGIKKEGVFGFRTIADAKNIEGLLPVTKTACVLGGGLIGLKAAYALKKRNIDVKVIVKSGQVLSQMLDLEAAGIVGEKIKNSGVDLILGQDVVEIIGEEGEIKAVKLDSNKVYGCSLVVVGKGVNPNTDLVKDSEIKVNQGIVANNLLQTSVENVYVAGDVCESFDLTLGKASMNALWPVAIEQGKIAGANMSGEKNIYPGSLSMNSLDIFGLPIISLGNFNASLKDAAIQEAKHYDAKTGLYKKLVFKNNILIGAILVGDIKTGGLFLKLIRDKIDVTSFKDKMLQANFGYPDIMDFLNERENIYV